MENFCQFATSHSQNHVMKLGEYAAMYLLSWSPVLWEIAQANNLFKSFDEAKAENWIHFVFPDEEREPKEYKAEHSKLKTRYLQQLEEVNSFQQSLNQLRRLLANIPCLYDL